MKTVNKFEVKGRISNIRNNERGTRGTFFVNSFINKKDVNLLMIADDGVPGNFMEGDCVIVRGRVEATMPEYGRSIAYKNVFHAEEIELSKTEMEKEFGVDGTYQAPDYFLAAFRGFISGVRRLNDNWGKLTLTVGNDSVTRNPSRIRMDYQIRHNRYLQLPPFEYEYNEPVQVICTVSTTYKEVEGSTKKICFQDLIVEDIVRLTRSEKDADAFSDAFPDRF